MKKRFFLVFLRLYRSIHINSMRIISLNTALFNTLAISLTCAASAGEVSSLEKRITDLEARILVLESRLSTSEAELKTVQRVTDTVQAAGEMNQSSFDILKNSAWRTLRWTRPEQWEGIRVGISEERVIELLGEAPRSVKSLKPRVDRVLYYETSLGDQKNALSGKISFYEGAVIAVRSPNFRAQETN